MRYVNLYLLTYLGFNVTFSTLGIVGVGPRCRLLASTGKVSATKVTNPKLDNLG